MYSRCLLGTYTVKDTMLDVTETTDVGGAHALPIHGKRIHTHNHDGDNGDDDD